MKKILASILTIFALFILASCQNDEPNYVLDNSILGTKIYSEYLSKIDFQETPVKNRENNAAGYEIYIPTDIAGSSYYTLTNIEESVYNKDSINDKFKSLNFTALSCANIDFPTILSQLKEINTSINTAYTNVTAKLAETITTSVEKDIIEDVTYHEGEVRCLAVLYMPIEIMEYATKEDGTATAILHTYALIPTYFEITYATNNAGNLDLVSTGSLNEYTFIKLNTSASLIKDLAE